MRKILTVLIILMCVSCGTNKRTIFLTENSNISLELETEDYSLINIDGIDYYNSNLEYTVNKSNYSFVIRVGNTISDLTETDPVIVVEEENYNELVQIKDSLKFEFYYMPICFNCIRDIDLARKQSVRFDSINNFFCKIITPRLGRKGLYAIHFYKVYESETLGNIKLQIIGHDLSKVQEEEMWRLAKSLKVKDHSSF